MIYGTKMNPKVAATANKNRTKAKFQNLKADNKHHCHGHVVKRRRVSITPQSGTSQRFVFTTSGLAYNPSPPPFHHAGIVPLSFEDTRDYELMPPTSIVRCNHYKKYQALRRCSVEETNSLTADPTTTTREIELEFFKLRMTQSSTTRSRNRSLASKYDESENESFSSSDSTVLSKPQEIVIIRNNHSHDTADDDGEYDDEVQNEEEEPYNRNSSSQQLHYITP